MNKIGFILGSKYVPPRREVMICMSGALLIIVGCPRDHGSIQMKLDDGGENL